MSAGTLKLTNNSTAVVGTSTVFTTDLKPGDFIVTTIGGVLYTLPVDTVTSNTAATLVSPFTGPTTTGAAWAAVPRKTMNQVTAELVAQSTEALRGLLTEKGVWTNFYTAPDDITVQLTSSMAPVTGPGWQKMAALVGTSQQVRSALPTAANLNNYGPTAAFTGIWMQGTSNNAQPGSNFPEPNAVGFLEVLPGGQFGGTQRYTVRNGNVYVRSLTAAWNGTDGPWGDWNLVGVNSRPGYYEGDLNALLSPGTWSVTAAATNGPVSPGQAGVATGICEVILRTSTNSLLQRYTNITTGAANINRTWQRTLSGTTWSPWEQPGAKVLNDIGIGTPNPVSANINWQTFAFVNGASYQFNAANWVNPPALLDSFTSGTFAINITNVSGDLTADGVSAWMHFTAVNYSSGGSRRIFQGIFRGAINSRAYHIEEIFTDSRVVPVANGGTGATTAAAARTALGVAYGTTAGSVCQGNDLRLNTVGGKSGGSLTSAFGRENATAGSFDSLYAGNKNYGLYFEQMNVPGAGYLYPHSSFKLYWPGNYGGVFTWSAWANTNSPEYVLSWTYESGTTPAQWRFNASTGNATATGNWINGGSTIKIKENVEDIRNPRETMRKIRACTWRLKTKNADGRFGIGVLAEGLYEDYPEAQVTSGDIELRDGTIVKDALSVQAGDSGVLAAVHHAAILSLMDENEAQQVEIEALKSNLEELKKIVEGLIAN